MVCDFRLHAGVTGSCSSPKSQPRRKWCYSLSRTFEHEPRIEPGMLADSKVLRSSNPWAVPAIHKHGVRPCGFRTTRLGSGSPIVTIMQPAQSRMRKKTTRGCGTRSVARCSLLESKMRAVFLVVAEVFREPSLQMTFVECGDVIQQVTVATAYPTLGNSVLPRTLERSADTFGFHRSDRGGDFRSILGIPVEDEKPGCRPKWKCLP